VAGESQLGLRLVLPVRGHTRASIVHGSKCIAALSWGGSDQEGAAGERTVCIQWTHTVAPGRSN